MVAQIIIIIGSISYVFSSSRGAREGGWLNEANEEDAIRAVVAETEREETNFYCLPANKG